MSRTFVESLEYFSTSPQLSTDGLFSSKTPESGNKCTKLTNGQSCGHNNYLTDLVCRNCGRSPVRISRLFWVLITSFIVVFHFLYSYGVTLYGSRESALNTLIAIFIVFALLLSLYMNTIIFKSKFLHAQLTVSAVTIVWVALSVSAILSWDNSFSIAFGAIGITLLIALVISIFNGAHKFCKRNNISPWIPFFIVLPVDTFLLALLLKIPLIANIVDPLKSSIFTWVEQSQIAQGLYLPTIISGIELSTKARLLLLFGYITVMFLGPGVMGAIKASVSGTLNALDYSADKVKIASKNIAYSARPIFVTWWAVNLYAISRSFLSPFLYFTTVFCFFVLFDLPFILSPSNLPMQEYSPLAVMGIAMVLIFILNVIIPLFVCVTAGYKARYWLKVWDNFTKAHVNILLWIIPCVVIVDLLFNQLEFNASKSIAFLFLMAVGAFALARSGLTDIFQIRRNK